MEKKWLTEVQESEQATEKNDRHGEKVSDGSTGKRTGNRKGREKIQILTPYYYYNL